MNYDDKLEPWVDAETVAAHLGFKSNFIRVMVRRGDIPGKLFCSGKREFWRFRLSDVDRAIAASSRITVHQTMPVLALERA